MPKGTEVAGLPSVLHALGYEVAAIGKLAHNGWEKIHYKFDHVAGPGLGGTNAEEVAKFLAERDSTKPLCLFVGTH